MIENSQLKERVCVEIERRTEDIESISRYVMTHPEPGFREHETAAFVERQFEALSIPYRRGLALTGIKGSLTGRSTGPTIAVLGELDALILPEHALADPVTGAAHACGHHAQIASMLGAAMGLQTVMPELDGNVALFAVPAEECIEIDWRLSLRRSGQIEFLVGKAELIRLGEFDDIDIAMLTHTAIGDGVEASVGDTHNGAIVKNVRFIGRSAHAGGSPWNGVNALKAALLAMNGIDAQRETFRDDANVRVHPIISKGGDIVTAVPSDVRMEMLIRGRCVADIHDAARKVDRALRAGALAVGASVEIQTLPAYLPCAQQPDLVDMARRNCAALTVDGLLGAPRHSTGSTDMGDLSQIMPVVQPRAGGVQGRPHSANYMVNDLRLAAVNPAKAMAMTVIDLLVNGAAGAARVIANAESPTLSKSDYLALRRGFDRVERFADNT